MRHSVEQMNLLLMYLSVIGIWIALPSVQLYIKRDRRAKTAMTIVGIITITVLLGYIFEWQLLFPNFTLAEVQNESKN